MKRIFYMFCFLLAALSSHAENVFSVDAEAEDADTPLDARAKEEEFEEPMDDTPPVPAVTAAACCQY